MADLLEKFHREVIGSKNKVYDYLPQVISKGDFNRISGINVILNSWRNILLTPIGSYDHDPDYGSDLYKLVFEPLDLNTAASIKDEVIYRLSLYDNRASITNVYVGLLPNRKGFFVNINVKYKSEVKELTIDLNQSLFLEYIGRSE